MWGPTVFLTHFLLSTSKSFSHICFSILSLFSPFSIYLLCSILFICFLHLFNHDVLFLCPLTPFFISTFVALSQIVTFLFSSRCFFRSIKIWFCFFRSLSVFFRVTPFYYLYLAVFFVLFPLITTFFHFILLLTCSFFFSHLSRKEKGDD